MKIDYLNYPLELDAAQSGALLLLDVPPKQRGKNLCQGRYGWVVAETIEETAMLQLSIVSGDWKALMAWSGRPSAAVQGSAIMLLSPAREPWPYIVLCRWHPTIAALAMKKDPAAVSRGRYSLEAFESRELAEHFVSDLTERLAKAGLQPI